MISHLPNPCSCTFSSLNDLTSLGSRGIGLWTVTEQALCFSTSDPCFHVNVSHHGPKCCAFLQGLFHVLSSLWVFFFWMAWPDVISFSSKSMPFSELLLWFSYYVLCSFVLFLSTELWVSEEQRLSGNSVPSIVCGTKSDLRKCLLNTWVIPHDKTVSQEGRHFFVTLEALSSVLSPVGIRNAVN